MEFDPQVVVIDEKEEGLDGCGIHQFVCSIKSSFRPPDFDRVEEYLMFMEKKMKREREEMEAKMKKIIDALSAEVEKKRVEKELLERKHAEEVSEKLVVQGELSKCKREREQLTERVTRLTEDQRVMLDREKRSEERYDGLFEELKRHEEGSARMNCRNRELECEKRLAEAEIEMWKKRFGELESRVLVLEKDTEILMREEPNFCGRMKGNLGARNEGFPECRPDREAGNATIVKNEMDLESTTENMENVQIDETMRNSIKKNHASPGAGSNCHTPNRGVPSMPGRGSGTPAFVASIILSDSDDELPKVIESASTCHDPKKVLIGKEELPQGMNNVLFMSRTTTQDNVRCKQESAGHPTVENALKRKEVSFSTHNPVFLKRCKGKTNAEENIGDTYNIFDSDDSSSDSDSDGDDSILARVMSKFQCNQRG